MSRNSYADYVKHWGELSTAIAANPDLIHLEPQRAELESTLEGLKEASIRQANLRRQAQEASIELSEYVARGRDLATRLRDSIKGYYGRTGEMLVEFRIPPRRPRTAPKVAKPPQPEKEPSAPENEKPSELGPNPARTAAPGTEASI